MLVKALPRRALGSALHASAAVEVYSRMASPGESERTCADGGRVRQGLHRGGTLTGCASPPDRNPRHPRNCQHQSSAAGGSSCRQVRQQDSQRGVWQGHEEERRLVRRRGVPPHLPPAAVAPALALLVPHNQKQLSNSWSVNGISRNLTHQ